MKWLQAARRNWIGLGVVIFFGALLLITSVSSAPPERVWLRAEGWSRAQAVATTRLEIATPLAVDERGAIYLLRTDGSATRPELRLLALDPAAQQTWEVTLDRPERPISAAQMVWDGTALASFWRTGDTLMWAQISPAGDYLVAPTPLADAVADFAALTVAPGQSVIWFADTGPTPQLWRVMSGQAPMVPQALGIDGERPQLRRDQTGALHAVWMQRTANQAELRYAPLNAAGELAAAAVTLADMGAVGGSVELRGPWFGLAGDVAHAGWHTRITGGMTAGQSFAPMIRFPLATPIAVEPPSALRVPTNPRPEYGITTPNGLILGARAALTAPGGNNPPDELAANPTPTDAAALACVAPVQVSANSIRQQACLIIFQAEQPDSYQLLSLSERSAFTPALISTERGDLYLTWRELRSEGAVIYLASTAPPVVAELAGVSLGDLLRIGQAISFSMLTGVIFAPFVALFWIGAALLLLIPNMFLQRWGIQTGRWGEIGSIGAALIGYWAAKQLILGDALRSVPFAQELPLLAPGAVLVVPFVLPPLLMIGAMLIGWRASYGRGVRSALIFVLVTTAIDSVASMAVYGAGLFGG